eukprot:Blabericola_migrator_1__782@NODE_1196_length_5141_cov_394_266062_g811_i0_p1_GENE_NODE_1196_length_5141_cov_394_266062_g811_i0NODE_1196_length_5141_cov_394_266062_g811_i0_p1_ORF_typecomplete_len486_score81_51Mannitol_dh_C/PF08125_13/0_0052Mannitol_dh_C/PF08125_13/1_1e02_NODE_1196_length_5141_cov_394_266062_g811_i035004957
MSRVTEWRIGYRRFRKGEGFGCKGEISNVVDDNDLTYLPVMQLLRLRQQAKMSCHHESLMRRPTTVQDMGLHIHIGCGKLGLGLVLKTLVGSGRRFVLFANPRGHWLEWKEARSMNRQLVVRFPKTEEPAIYLDLLYENDALDKLTQTHTGGCVLVCDKDSKVRTRLLQEANTMSIAVGGSNVAAIGDWLATNAAVLRSRSTPLTLFACENDHKAVSRLEARIPWVKTVPCMVDRICSDIAFEMTQDAFEIRVGTEHFGGEIVVLKDFDGALPFTDPKSTETVRASSLSIQADYFAQRKFLLVNGGHTTLAFLTMLRLHENDPHFIAPGRDVLLNWTTCTDEERAILWCFSLARILLLFWQYDTDVLKNAHGVDQDEDLINDLLAYAQQTLTRFNAVADTTDRILAGGVEDRYHGRLENLESFINLQFDGLNSISRGLLEVSRCQLTSLISTIHVFTSRCKIFVPSLKKKQCGLIADIRLPKLAI